MKAPDERLKAAQKSIAHDVKPDSQFMVGVSSLPGTVEGGLEGLEGYITLKQWGLRNV